MSSSTTRKVPGKNGRGVTYTNGDGYYFVINNKRYLKCTERSVLGKLEGDRLVITSGDYHSHPPDLLRESVSALKQQLKEQSKAMLGGTVRKVFTEACDKAEPAARAAVSLESCQAAMYRARASLHPPVPDDIHELYSLLTDERYCDRYGKCPDGSLMTRGLVGPPGHESVVITSDVILNVLVAAVWLFIDGTFAVRPDNPPSRQLLVISALYQNMLFPACFALMVSKAEVAYRSLFSFLKELAPSLSPRHIVTDYEAALVPPIRDLFPATSHQGCWFHFCQALHRNVVFLGLNNTVKNNYNALTIVRMCYVLPLLPASQMVQGLNAIEYVAHTNDLLSILQPFLDYIRGTWIEGVGPELISVFRSLHRTNNFSESNHKAFQDRVKSIRPGTWDFVRAINNELIEAHLDVIRVQSAQRTKRNRRAQWVRQDMKINKWLDELENGTRSVLEFLVVAQNNARKLQRVQFHLPVPTTADPTDYPAPLQAAEDPDDVPPSSGTSHGPEDQSSQGTSEGASQEVTPGPSQEEPMPLLMPAGNIDLSTRLVVEDVDLLPASQEPSLATSSTSQATEQEPHARGRRRGRPRLARPSGASSSRQPSGRPRGRPRGSRARRRGAGRGARRGASSSEEEFPELPSDEEEARTLRSGQIAVQEQALQATQRAAAGAETPSNNKCLICLDHTRDHAAVPCGHGVCCPECAPRAKEALGECPLCRAEILMVIRIFL